MGHRHNRKRTRSNRWSQAPHIRHALEDSTITDSSECAIPGLRYEDSKFAQFHAMPASSLGYTPQDRPSLRQARNQMNFRAPSASTFAHLKHPPGARERLRNQRRRRSRNEVDSQGRFNVALSVVRFLFDGNVDFADAPI